MEYMQLNTPTQTNPASAGSRGARQAEASERRATHRRRPTLSRRELRRIIAEMIG
jgi:hypothetical protein